jgi:hypothetical protein
MPTRWSNTAQRQYEHVTQGELERDGAASARTKWPRELEIAGRNTMNRAELATAIGREL